MPSAPIRVFIASDQAILSDALKTILDNTPELSLEVVGVACSGKELMLQIESLTADVLLLDNQLPDTKGINLINKIKNANPLLKVVLLTLYKGVNFAIDAIELGAKGVLTKRAEPKIIANLVAAIHNNGLIFYLKEDIKDSEPSICEKLASLLEKREMEIVCLMADGASNREIATQLNMSEKNLEKIKRQLYDELKKLDEFKNLHSQGIGTKLAFFVGACNFCNQAKNNNLEPSLT